MERHRRSLAKAASHHRFATTMVVGIVLAFTGHVGSSAKIGIAAAAGKTTLYDGWERLWNRIE